MQKLDLKMESLRVESFVTSSAPAQRGTVNAREIIDTEICNDTNNTACFTYGTFCWPACGSNDTCGSTCLCTQTDKPSECHDCEI